MKRLTPLIFSFAAAISMNAEEPTQQAIAKPAQQTAEKPAQEAAEEPAQEAAEKPAEQATEESTQKPVEEPAHRAKILELKGQIQKTPELQFRGPKNKPAKQRDWIEIEAEVEVETTDDSGFIPELEASWFAVINDKHNNDKPVRLLGKTTFKNINTSNGNVFLSAYIEPDTLERFTGKARPNERDIEGFALTLSGPGIITKAPHDRGLTKATAEEESKWWLSWKHESFDHFIIPKSKTPFAPLWTDYYPTEKIAE